MNPVFRRYVVFFILLTAFTTSGISQIRFGLRGGIYSTRFNSAEYDVGNYLISCPGKPVMGYHVGIVAQAEISNVFFQPELLFCSIGNNINIDDEITRLELNKIDLPLILGYKFNSFKIQTGPVASVLISDKSDFSELTSGYDLLMERVTIGFQVGLGFDISQLALDFKYEGSLSNIAEGVEVGDELLEFDPRANQFLISIGLFFNN